MLLKLLPLSDSFLNRLVTRPIFLMYLLPSLLSSKKNLIFKKKAPFLGHLFRIFLKKSVHLETFLYLINHLSFFRIKKGKRRCQINKTWKSVLPTLTLNDQRSRLLEIILQPKLATLQESLISLDDFHTLASRV